MRSTPLLAAIALSIGIDPTPDSSCTANDNSGADGNCDATGPRTEPPRTLGLVMSGSINPSNMSPDELRQVRSALAIHGVIVFRNQQWTAEEQRNFTVQLGDGLEPAVDGVLQYTLFTEDEDPSLQGVIRFSRDTHQSFGYDWHTDLSFAERPSYSTVLWAEEAPPPNGGGETHFADLMAAYDHLPDTASGHLPDHDHVEDMTKELARQLTVQHHYASVAAINASTQCTDIPEWRRNAAEWTTLTDHHRAKLLSSDPVSHPFVRKHHVTGRLCFNPLAAFGAVATPTTGTPLARREGEGVDTDEQWCQAWLRVARGMTAATAPQFVYRHTWQTGDVVVWDNVCTLHQAQPLKRPGPTEPMGSRVMRRTSSIGPLTSAWRATD